MNLGELIDQVCRFASRLIQDSPVAHRSAPNFLMKKAIIGFVGGVAACLSFGASSLAAQSMHILKGRVCVGSEGRASTLEKNIRSLQISMEAELETIKMRYMTTIDKYA